ncbi:MAG: ABC transporter ATP-binding protein [Pseudomonadota bacterium]
MFRFFETLIDPYQPYDQRREFPGTLVAFYFHLLWPARWLILVSMVLGLMVAVIEVLMISYASDLVDILMAADPETLWADHKDQLIVMIIVTLAIRPFAYIVDAFLMQQGFYAPMATLVRWRTHRKLLRQSVSFFSDDFAGRLANKQLQLAPALNDSVYLITNALWYALTFILGAAVVLGEVDLRLLIPLALWFGAYICLALWFVPKITRAGMQVAEARSVLAGRIVDSYTNIQTVKLFAHGDAEEKYSKAALDDFRAAFARQSRIHTKLEIAMTGLSTFLIGGVIGYAIWLWAEGAVTVGVVAAAVALVVRLLGLVEWIMWNLTSLFQNIGTVQEGMETISQPVRLKDKVDAQPLKLAQGEIRFDHVTHSYGRKPDEDSGPTGVTNIDLTIAGGERVGLVGRSGAGKSTLVNLALRFHDPDAGRVLIDGQDLAACQQDSIRAQIAMVTQDTSLLHRSIADNIRYGRPEATEDELWEAARRVSADQFIPDLEDRDGFRGMQAQVGERGVRLSGGQRQRIALARAVLKNAPILILDEATSALDSEVEAEIQQALYEFMAGKTVIAIAHRLSTIQRMHRIVVMDAGGIAEQGTHEALLAHGGLYARFWERQSGGMIGTAAAE